jgi:hypothetical protein
MKEQLTEKMKHFTIILLIATCLFGIINTLCILYRFQELENKIEVNKTFKSEYETKEQS